MNRAPTIRLIAAFCVPFVLGATWAKPSSADISLTPIGNLDVGGNNYSVITSDLNRDGALDLVTTSWEFNRVSVFLGNGDGTFRARLDYATANAPNSVAAGDLNLDGIPDLLVANGGARTVSALIGVGDGTFVRGSDFDASPNPYFVGIADVNGDGRPDAIGAVFSSIFVRLGNGDGTFGARTDVPLPGCAVGEIQAADLNGDGRLDLAVTNNCSGLLHILLGYGNGSFQPPLSYAAAGSPLSCDIGDLNGDGRLDLVVSGGSTLALSVFLGNGDGTFLPRTEFGTDVEPIGVRIGDFNSDTIPDLAVTTGEGRALDVLAGRGDGTFDPKHGYPTGPGYALTVGDWDRDGLPDLAASTFDQTGHHLSLFHNTPGVPVGSSPVLTAPSSVSGNVDSEITFAVSVADPDGEPITELGVSPPPPGASFTVDPSKSSGTFRWTPTSGQQGGPYRVVFFAYNSLAASAKTLIYVGSGSNHPPVLNPIGSKAVNELALLSFTATATDPDAGQTLTFLLYLGAPAATGATLNGTTGAFNWTPTEAQGPGSYSITVQVTDNGNPQLSAVEGITIGVNEVNTAPVLAAIGNKAACSVGALFTFTATATDADIPANVLTFSLDPGAPSGATINGSTGAFSWTPSSPGSFPVAVRVTDNGTPPLGDFELITITVSQGAPNQPPVLSAIGNKTVNELTPLAFTAVASDPGPCPGETLTFSLDAGAPAGSTINGATGAFAWTPTEAQGPGSFPITVRVTDNGSPPLSDAETFVVTVNEVNFAPVLTPIGNKFACVGVPFTFTATATDADIPANVLTFSLDAGAPPGATINSSTGVFSWTPSTLGSPPVTVRVTDNGTPPLSDFEVISFTVLVDCGGGPPVLAAIGNKTVNEQIQLAFTATATDPSPGATLTFSLDPGAPAGASIQASTGAFNWTPTEFQGPGSFQITVRVTDNGSPPLGDFETITVTVNEVNVAPILGAIGSKIVTVGSTLTFTPTATDSDVPPNTLCFSIDAGSPPGVTMSCLSGVFMWTPSLGQVGTYAITVRVTDNGLPPLSDSETITVTVVPQANAPTANAGGPYSGIVNSAVNFDGTGSSDPNGDALTYAWNFGDGGTGSGATPLHTYTAPGTYAVTLRVTDPTGNLDDDATTATIGAEVSVTLVLKNGKSTLSLGDDVLKLGVEELELPYQDIIVGTLRLSTDFPNAGTVPECSADPKHTGIGDLDRNGVSDLDVRFPIACVRNLFRNTPNNTSLNLIVTGSFQASTGAVPFRGVKIVTIKRGGGGSAPVLAYPNPFNPQGRLSFVTTRPGSASIQLFDLQGRLVKTLLGEQYLGAGAHEVTIDGLSDQGVSLSSGVYYYRVSTQDGVTEGSISILK